MRWKDLRRPEQQGIAHRDLEALAVCKLHELCHVLHIARPEHGDRLWCTTQDCRTAYQVCRSDGETCSIAEIHLRRAETFR
jgi:hypothetical protein